MAAAHSRLGGSGQDAPLGVTDSIFSPDPTWEPSREQAYVPAQQPAPPQDARVSAPDAHPRRTGHPGLSAAQGPYPAGCLSAGRFPECCIRPVDDHVLPQPLRLRRSPEFLLAARQGRRSVRPTLVAHVWQPATDDLTADSAVAAPARVGFVVGRKVGSAVTRNRVKRRLRHLMRPRIDSLSGGSLCVIRALPLAASADYRELERDLHAALRKVIGDRS